MLRISSLSGLMAAARRQAKSDGPHMPEKSGIAAAPCVAALAAAAGSVVCPIAGVAAAATKVTTKRNVRCTFMATSCLLSARSTI
jgi:hypothetical protein